MLGDVRDPQLIRPVGSKRAGHEVAWERDRVRLRPSPLLASKRPDSFKMLSDGIHASGRPTGQARAARCGHPQQAIGPPRRRMDLPDRRGQFSMRDHLGGRVRLASKPRDIARTLHARPVTVNLTGNEANSLIDERELHFREDVPSAKKATALKSRSRSMHSTRSSRRRRMSSSRPSDVTPGFLPPRPGDKRPSVATPISQSLGPSRPSQQRPPHRRRGRPSTDGNPPEE